MPRPTPDARQRLVAGAADMLRRRGLSATSIRDLAAHAKAPLGSTYHYFPGGKQQLVAEAVRYAGDAVACGLRVQLERGPVEGVRSFVALWRSVVVGTGFRAGCPVLAVAVEEPAGDETTALAAAAEVFDAWQGLLADSLARHGADRDQARQVATLVVAAVEGTVALCRAKRTADPLDAVGPHLEALVAGAVAARSGGA